MVVLSNTTPGTILSSNQSLFETLESVPGFLIHPIFSYGISFLALTIGALGMFHFVRHCLGKDGKGVYAVLGGLAYILNPSSIITFQTASIPSMWWYAIFPWAVYTYFRFLTDREAPFRKRIISLIAISILTFPAFTVPLNFVTYLATLLLISFGLWFTPSVFRSVWITPALFFLILLLQLHWLGPFVVSLVNNPVLLQEGIIRLKPADYRLFNGPIIIPFIVALLGILRFRFSHLPVLAIALTASLFFLPWLPQYLTFLHPYQSLTLIPGAFALSYLFAFGALTIHILVGFTLKQIHKQQKKGQPVWEILHGKSPFDIYDELIKQTKEHHGHRQFTLLKFTEQFVHHVMTESERQLSKSAKNRSTTIRSVGFALFTLLLVTNLGLFRGLLFPAANKVPYNSDLVSIISFLEELPPTKRVHYIHTEANDSTTPGDLELKAALQSEDTPRFKTALEKYQIAYLLLDEQYLPPTIRRFIVQSNLLKKIHQAGSIQLYATPNATIPTQLLSLIQNAPNIGPEASTVYHDVAYEQYGLYVTHDAQPYDAYYPFLGLADLSIDFEEKQTSFQHRMNQNLMKRLDQYELETASEEAEVQMVKENGEVLVIPYSLYTELYGDRLQIIMDTQKVRTVPGPSKKQIASEFTLSTLEQQYGYLVMIDSGDKSDSNYLIDITGKNSDYPYHTVTARNNFPTIIPSAYYRGVGYTFTIAPGSFTSMSLYYLPFEDIIRIRLVKPDAKVVKAGLTNLPYLASLNNSVLKIDTSKLPPDPETLAVMFQPYDTNWLAYRIDESRLTTIFDRFGAAWLPFRYGRLEEGHVKINNWANGWLIDTRNPSPLVLVYWPHYFTFIGWLLNGFLLGFFVIIGAFQWYKAKNS